LLYADTVEAIPDSMPKARGNVVTMFLQMSTRIGRDVERTQKAGCVPVFDLSLNRAPIMWLWKRQNTVEASKYGSKLLALTSYQNN
jgi:hypothetical protein